VKVTAQGFGGGIPSLRRQTGRWGDLYRIFKNIWILTILRSKFLLKTRFYITAKSVLMRPQGLHTWSRFPLAPPLTTPLESKKGKFFWGNRKNLAEERVVRKISSLNGHAPTSRRLIVVVQSPIPFQVLSQNGETTCPKGLNIRSHPVTPNRLQRNCRSACQEKFYLQARNNVSTFSPFKIFAIIQFFLQLHGALYRDISSYLSMQASLRKRDSGFLTSTDESAPSKSYSSG